MCKCWNKAVDFLAITLLIRDILLRLVPSKLAEARQDNCRNSNSFIPTFTDMCYAQQSKRRLTTLMRELSVTSRTGTLMCGATDFIIGNCFFYLLSLWRSRPFLMTPRRICFTFFFFTGESAMALENQEPSRNICDSRS